jgi:O-antigen ligase
MTLSHPFSFLRISGLRGNGPFLAGAGVIALAIAFLVPVVARLFEPSDLAMLVAVSVLLILAVQVFTYPVTNNPKLLTWRVGLILWAFLLSCEQFFFRSMSSATAALDSNFAGAAYAEAGTWVVCALLIFLVIARGGGGSLAHPWSGNFRFLWLFVAWCFVSSFYSPARPLAFAWLFKLILALLVLKMCSSGIHDRNDIRTFLLATFWGFALLTLLPVFHGVITGHKAFAEDGRLDYFDHPVHGSQLAGITLLLALIVFEGRPKLIAVWMAITAVIMVASGGKAGLLAAMICATMLFILRRHVHHALLLVVGLGAVAWAVLSYTPVSGYMEEYSDSGAVISLTGRTELWKAGMPMIMQSPIAGHGYMSSRFISQSNDMEDFNWAPSQMHNSFLEIAYTGGILGLILLLSLHYRIGTQLTAAVKSSAAFAAAGLALYADVLMQSWVEGSVAGKASDNFLLLMALLMMSEKIVQFEKPAKTPHFIRAGALAGIS